MQKEQQRSEWERPLLMEKKLGMEKLNLSSLENKKVVLCFRPSFIKSKSRKYCLYFSTPSLSQRNYQVEDNITQVILSGSGKNKERDVYFLEVIEVVEKREGTEVILRFVKEKGGIGENEFRVRLQTLGKWKKWDEIKDWFLKGGEFPFEKTF